MECVLYNISLCTLYICFVLNLVLALLLLQEVNITLEDVCHIDEPKTKEPFHFAMNGKSFAIIAEHFPDMLQKV